MSEHEQKAQGEQTAKARARVLAAHKGLNAAVRELDAAEREVERAKIAALTP